MNSPLVKSQDLGRINSQKHGKTEEGNEEGKPRLIYRVTTGSLSADTKVSYQKYINDFLAFYKITNVDIVKDWSPKLARQHLIDYVIHLRDFKRFPRGSINVHIAAVSHFFYMIRDDATRLDMTKVRMELPPDEFTHRDRPYTVEEIQKMLSVCPRAREKVIILLLTSTGMRIGAIHSLKIGDLQPNQTSKGKVYLVKVYSLSPSHTYVTPCSPECATALDEYFEDRLSKADEVLKNDSPLIRNLYEDIKKKAVKPLTRPGIFYVVNTIIKKSGIKSGFQFKGEAKRALGFRKFYKTQAEESGMKSINVEIAHGHSIGVSGHYYRPKPSEILHDYITHAADALTISDEHRLKKQVEELETSQLAEISRIKSEVQSMREVFERREKREAELVQQGFETWLELTLKDYRLKPLTAAEKQARAGCKTLKDFERVAEAERNAAAEAKLLQQRQNQRGVEVGLGEWSDCGYLDDDDNDNSSSEGRKSRISMRLNR